MTVRELLGRLSSRELSEWRAFDRIENEDRTRRDMDSRAAAGVAARAPRVMTRGGRTR